MPDGAVAVQKVETGVVFVFGALRSGTTMLRLMLKHHPRIDSPGETDFLFDYLRPDPSYPTGWHYDLDGLRSDRIFVDKHLTLPAGMDGLDLLSDLLAQMQRRSGAEITMVSVHRHAPRIADCVPGARIVHLLRDPRDVARSSIGMGWAGTLYHGVDHWIGTETGWRQAASGFAPDKVLTLRYEALLTDLEAQLRRLCAFLGLDYDPAMLEYHRHSTYAPPDASLTEQWRRKSTPADIALVEGKAGPLMRDLGYQLAGKGHHPGLIRRLGLSFRNRSARLSFRVRRYGLTNTVLEFVTRKLGLPAHARIKARFDAITRKHLK